MPMPRGASYLQVVIPLADDRGQAKAQNADGFVTKMWQGLDSGSFQVRELAWARQWPTLACKMTIVVRGVRSGGAGGEESSFLFS